MRLYSIRVENIKGMQQQCRDVPSARLHNRRCIERHLIKKSPAAQVDAWQGMCICRRDGAPSAQVDGVVGA